MPTYQLYGLGTRPPLASVSKGRVENVTAGSLNSPPSFSCAYAQAPLPNRRPAMSSHDTVRLAANVRAVTVSRSATVRQRTMNADNPNGIISISATQDGPAST